MTKASVQRLTSQQPGAVAILEVRGDVNAITSTLGLQDLPVGGLQLRSLPDVPDVLIARAGASSMQFMPTGGPHIVERLLSQLISAGCDLQDTPVAPWPSSQEAIEQAMAIDLPNAASPLATELLLDQPRRWREFAGDWTADDDARSQRLCHLLHRPRIAVFGHANIGKSTLLNRLAGRERAKTQDASGTTRDYVSVELDLAGLLSRGLIRPVFRTPLMSRNSNRSPSRKKPLSLPRFGLPLATQKRAGPQVTKMPICGSACDGISVRFRAQMSHALLRKAEDFKKWCRPSEER